MRTVKISAALLFLVSAALAGFFVFTSPVAFQKSASIRFVDETLFMLPEPEMHIDIEAILRPIPYSDSRMVYEVAPNEKYIQTIEQGHGNCSNLAFGLAYALSEQGHDYQIVHLMPINGFLNGIGHTVLHMPFRLTDERHYGIVDVLEGGLPQTRSGFVHLDTLRNGSLSEASIFSLNQRKDNESPYYDSFLDTAIVGVIYAQDVEQYFDFLESVYVPLGNKKLEKIFYDGLSLVCGTYPPNYVLKTDQDILYKGKQAIRYLSIALLLCIRVFLLLMAMIMCFRLYSFIRKRVAYKRA